MGQWYLSFAVDIGWLGACVVVAESAFEAITVSHLRGINPGGEVQLVDLGEVKAPEGFPLHTLITDREKLDNF